MSFGIGIGDVVSVLRLAGIVLERLANAPEQFISTSNSVRTLSSILEKIKDSATGNELSQEQKKALIATSQGCTDALGKLQDALDRHKELEVDSAKKTKLPKIFRRTAKKLTWDKNEIENHQKRIDSCIHQLNLVFNEINNSNLDKMRKREDEKDNEKTRQDILKWLDADGYTDKHSKQQLDFCEGVCDGTDEWLLTSSEFQNWLSVKDRILHCYGDPGAGNTMLAAAVVNRLLNPSEAERSMMGDGAGVAFFYCSFRQQEEQSKIDIFNCLLHRLLLRITPMPEIIKNMFDRHKQNRTRPSSDEILTLLHAVMRGNYSRVFVVIDALDEIGDDSRDDILSELLELPANVFITSRPIPKITNTIGQCKRAEALRISARKEDVQRYLDSCKLPDCLSSKGELRAELKNEIVIGADGIFLVARLYMGFIKECVTVKQVKAELEKIKKRKGSSAYNDAYERTVERIKALPEGHRRRLAETALTWITCAQRPLSPQEIRVALAVEVGDCPWVQKGDSSDGDSDESQEAENSESEEVPYDEDSLPSLDEVLAVCSGILTIDKKRNVIRFVHYTTQEYFERILKTWLPDAQQHVALACMTYLSVVARGYCYDGIDDRIQKNPLCEYAGLYWGRHVKMASMETSEPVIAFLRNGILAGGAAQVFLDRNNYDDELIITPLHLAASFGLDKAFTILVKSSRRFVDVDLRDTSECTPLHWAARYNHEAAVKELLALGADLDPKTTYGITPLDFAARYNNLSAVKVLLAAGADPNIQSDRGNTSLHQAAQNGHVAVTKNLIASGASLNLKNKDDMTPLDLAMQVPHDNIVRLLQEVELRTLSLNTLG